MDELYSEQKLKKICFYDSLSIRGRSHLSHAECVMCMQRNGYSFTVFLGEPDLYYIENAWISTGPVTARDGERLWKAMYVEDGVAHDKLEHKHHGL
jgi:hypothetical protein